MTNLTDTTLALFDSLADDAGNWSGTPLFDGTKELRGNLTQLKRAGLVKSFMDDGNSFVSFTEAGIAFAAERGFTWYGYGFEATRNSARAVAAAIKAENKRTKTESRATFWATHPAERKAYNRERAAIRRAAN